MTITRIVCRCASGPHSAENGLKIQEKKTTRREWCPPCFNLMHYNNHRYRHQSIESILSVVGFPLSRVLRTTATHKIKTNELYVMQKERSFLIAKSHGEKQNKTKKK